jgi:O-methyltransferase involved in polyketide biosynthesis
VGDDRPHGRVRPDHSRTCSKRRSRHRAQPGGGTRRSRLAPRHSAEILEYKTETLKNEKPVCRYEPIQLDLTDVSKREALFAQIGANSSRVLVVTEGLLIYLTADQVATLARDLHAPPSFKWWVIDLASPRLLAMMQKMWGRSVNAGNAPFQFAPADGTQFFEAYGWTEAEYHPAMESAQRLHREMKMMWLWRLLARMRSKKVREEFRRINGFVLMERV